jgi:hypothetical protein
VDQFRLRTATLIVATALVGLGVGLATGLLGDDDPPAPAPVTVAGEEQSTEPEASEGKDQGDSSKNSDLPRTEDDPEGIEPGPTGPLPSSEDETAAADAARRYVEAINAEDGQAVCRAFADDGLNGLKLPVVRGSCSESLDDSIGFHGKAAQVPWARSEMTQDVSAQIDGDAARVVATVFTEYADGREPTIEDDIIYLARSGDRWLVVKPSSTLYRAVGIADVPLDALQPPG